MPSVPSSSKVFVTGANGFIAATTCKILIERGYKVVGAVRSSSKGEWLAKKLGSSFTYVVVPDIEKPDAFDQAIKDTNPDAVLHMASPVTNETSNPALVIGPAVSGTTNILESVTKHGPNVRRIVVTSSVASIAEPKDGPYTFTEADWNTFSPGEVERKGSDAGVHVYRAAKVTAERAAWKFVEDNKSKINFDLATVLPPLVYGPIEQEPPKSVDGLNMTMLQFYQNMVDPPPPNGLFSLNIVDVRDAALLHVLCLEKEEAGGQRWIPSNGPFTWMELRDLAIAASVQGVAPGTPKDHVAEPPKIIMDGSKAQKVLGLKYHSKAETVVDAIQSIYLTIPSAVPAKDTQV